MYLKVGSTLYQQQINKLSDLMLIMSRHGMYVMDDNDETVTDQDISERIPFKLVRHFSFFTSIIIDLGAV